jgi:hypothetical protein
LRFSDFLEDRGKESIAGLDAGERTQVWAARQRRKILPD